MMRTKCLSGTIRILPGYYKTKVFEEGHPSGGPLFCANILFLRPNRETIHATMLFS